MSNRVQEACVSQREPLPRTGTRGRVSVVIPTFNHARYVGDAIRSVLAQDHHDVEILVVDDGSEDETAAVVSQFGDRVHYFYQENQGLSAARNTGIRAATGALVGVLDADDLYEPCFVSTMVALLETNPDAAGAYCGYQFVDEENRLLPQREARLASPDGLYEALLDGNFLVPESLLVRLECYDRAGAFDPALRALEDWDMWLRISRHCPLVGTERVLTRHRILSGSMSTDPTRMHLNRMAVLEKHLGAVPPRPDAADEMITRAYGRAHLVSAIEYLQSGDRQRAADCLRQMARICPALLLELDTFYLLGCGSQPKGWMGDFSSLDLDRNADVLLAMLDSVFREHDGATRLGPYQRPAYANAHLSMGLLNYGAQRFRESRRLLARAALTDPRVALGKRTVSTMLKSLPVANRLVRRRRGAVSG